MMYRTKCSFCNAQRSSDQESEMGSQISDSKQLVPDKHLERREGPNFPSIDFHCRIRIVEDARVDGRTAFSSDFFLGVHGVSWKWQCSKEKREQGLER